MVMNRGVSAVFPVSVIKCWDKANLKKSSSSGLAVQGYSHTMGRKSRQQELEVASHIASQQSGSREQQCWYPASFLPEGPEVAQLLHGLVV